MSTTDSANDELRALVERASALEPAPVAVVPTVRMIALRSGARWLAVPAEGVREVVTLESITKVPGVGDRILGVALIRGRLVPVVDLPGVLGIARSGGNAAATRPRLVVLARDDDEVGIIADETRGVLELPVVTTTVAGLIRGELRWQGHMVAVLESDAIVAMVAAA